MKVVESFCNFTACLAPDSPNPAVLLTAVAMLRCLSEDQIMQYMAHNYKDSKLTDDELIAQVRERFCMGDRRKDDVDEAISRYIAFFRAVADNA